MHKIWQRWHTENISVQQFILHRVVEVFSQVAGTPPQSSSSILYSRFELSERVEYALEDIEEKAILE